MNVRMYHPSRGQWTTMWQHSARPEVRTLTSEVRDDGLMHMWATHPDMSERRHPTFHVVSKRHWYRIESRSEDEGETWMDVVRLDAFKATCPAS